MGYLLSLQTLDQRDSDRGDDFYASTTSAGICSTLSTTSAGLC